MKKTLLFAVLTLVFDSFAQITLSSADFASAGDTVRMSQATDNGYDYATTGSNYTWDFSTLTPDAQILKDYSPISNAPVFVQFVFGAFAPVKYQASYFMPSTELPLAQITSFLPITIEDIFQYTKKSADSLTSVGISMKVSLSGNSTDLPVKSDTIETPYDFPLIMGNTHFSRGYTSVDFNPIYDAKWNQHRTRWTTVDGYGSITTPYGTFDALRIKHDIDEMDSLYMVLPIIGGTWVPLDVPESHIYEWWTNGEKEPILRFTTNVVLGNEVVTAIEYRDIYRGLDAGMEEINIDYTMYPNPVVDDLMITSKDPITSLKIINVNGEIVEEKSIDNDFELMINVSHFPVGTYQVHLFSNNKSAVKSFVKQ